MNFLFQQWFLCALLVIIPVGMLAGQSPSVLEWAERWLNTQALVFVVLFCMTVTLKLDQLRTTAAKPAGVLLAVLISSGLMPLLAWGLFLLTEDSPLAAGLLLIGIVPNTLATAAVWTRRAGGNDAIPLMVTLLTNASCFLVIPFWFWLALGQNVSLDPQKLMLNLLITAFLPMCLGQAVRTLPQVAGWVDNRKNKIGLVAQLGVLTVVAAGSLRTGPILRDSAADLSLLVLAGLLLLCLLLHGAGALAGWFLAKALALPLPDRIGVLFAGSQKTLPIAMELATSPILLASGLSPLIILPPLMFHAAQLVMDSFLMEWVRPRSQ